MMIETERLRLRPFGESDLDELYELASDPEVMRFSLAGPHSREQTEKGLKRLIKLQRDKGFSPWAVFRKSDNRFMGYCGIQIHDIDGVEEHEVTYRFLPKYWGNGYATEAAIACQRFAFEKLGFVRIISLIEPENIRSVMVAKRGGLEKEKTVDFKGIVADVYSVMKDNKDQEES